MAVSQRVDVGERAESLVSIQFDEEHGHRLLHLVVVLEHAVDGLRDVVHHHIQIDFVLLKSCTSEQRSASVAQIELGRRHPHLPCRPGCRTRAAK